MIYGIAGNTFYLYKFYTEVDHASHYSTEQGCTMTSDGQKQPLLAFSQELEGKLAIYAFHKQIHEDPFCIKMFEVSL